MRKPGMIQLESSHFSNVIGAVQRTGSLTGGAVRGLPNGIVVGGLVGIGSFASSLGDAQKEFQLGRPRASLERIRQLENEFNGIASRWNSTVMSVIANARQGRQGVPAQKLNEVKNAQTRMQQLTGPVSKAFRDLVTALEYEVTMEGRKSLDADADSDAESEERAHSEDGAEPAMVAHETATQTAVGETPDPKLPGRFATDYKFGAKLRLQRVAEKKVHVVPKLEKQTYYFTTGFDPPRVIRIENLQRNAIVVFDTSDSNETVIEARKLSTLIKRGLWVLQPKTENRSGHGD